MKMKTGLKKWWKPLLLIAIAVLFLIYPPVVLAEIRVDFEKADYTAGHHWKALTSYTENVGLDSVKDTYAKTGEARVFFWDIRYRDGQTLKRMDPIDYNMDDEIRVKDMAFFINGVYAGQLSGEELLSMFTTNEQVDAYLTDTGSLGLSIKGDDSQLLTNDAFHEFYSSLAKRYARTGVLYLIPLLAALTFVVEFYRRRIWAQREDRFFLAVDTLLYSVGVAALALIVVGVFTGSSLVNPDESEAIYSVQYYMTHWKVPDARALDLAAYSVFGTARLTELDLFYPLAALIARFFTFEHAARLFSVLMIAGLFYLLFWNLKKNRFLLAVLFLTPQVWYLYTYCTSDALDFAVGVLVLYQVARPDSMLQRMASQGARRQDWWRILLLGFLFSNIFMSKQNYYVFAIYAFGMLLTDLLTAPKEKRGGYLRICLLVAGAAILCLGIRYIPEFLHYGVHRQQILREMQEKIAIPELNPASVPAVQSPAFNLYGKGTALYDILFTMGLNKTLFCSFAGTYGSLQFPGPEWYYGAMGVLYAAYVVLTGLAVLWERGHGER